MQKKTNCCCHLSPLVSGSPVANVLPMFSSLSAGFDLGMNHTAFWIVTRQSEKRGRGRHSVKHGGNEGSVKKGEKITALQVEQMAGEVMSQGSWAVLH